jgi:hypothetical protein
MSWKLVGAATVALALAACGTNPQDRTSGGAAAGAATGAGIGAFGGPVGALAGAAVGGGVGAATGAATKPSDVNLGTPPWSNPEVRTPMDEQHRATTRSRTRAHTAAARRAPTDERDRAYMGGGMVGTDQTTGTTGTAPSGTGTAPR